MPEPVDVLDYAHDLSYLKEIQGDLFVFLLPVCLRVLSLYVRGQGDQYAGATELFWHGLNRRPGALSLLSEAQASAVDRYIREFILAAIDHGCSDYLRSVLKPDELCAAIDRCTGHLPHPEDRDIAVRMKDDFDSRR